MSRVLSALSPARWDRVIAKLVTKAIGVNEPILVFVGSVIRYSCYIHVFTEYIGDITVCVGPSMLPTINESGDIYISSTISRRLDELTKGTVVVATSPKDPSGSVCKRVLALPGDRVCTNPDSFGIKKYQTMPKGHVWLQGDNLSNSTDSRSYGPVPIGLIKSKLLVRVWPPNEATFMNHHYDPDDWPSEKAEADMRTMVASKSAARPALDATADTADNTAAPTAVQPDAGYCETPTAKLLAATPAVALASPADESLGGADAVALEATATTAARPAMLSIETQEPATIEQPADRLGASLAS